MTHILVTGGAGYIGSHCVRLLLDAGHTVVVLDNLSTGFTHLLDRRATFVQGSTLDQRCVETLLQQHAIEVVMHFAASAYVGESVTKPAKYYENNVVGTLNLLTAMKNAGVSQLVFSSTCAVYGTPDQVPLMETLPLNPINPYGASKRMAEAIMADFSTAYNFRYVALRYFNAAGAHPDGSLGECHDPETHLIPLVLQVALGQRPHITVFGNDYNTPDGTCIRDYIHILDIGRAHLDAMAYLMDGGQSNVFNLGNGTGYSVQQVIDTCRSITSHPIPVELGERRPGDPPRLIAKADKAHQVLQWQPEYPDLSKMIETAWQWALYQTNAQTTLARSAS